MTVTKTIELSGGPIDGERHRVPLPFMVVHCLVDLGEPEGEHGKAIYVKTSRKVETPEGPIEVFEYSVTEPL